MRPLDRLVGTVTDRPKTVITVLLVVILLVAAGGANIEEQAEMEMFEDDPTEIDALTAVHDRFDGGDANTTHLSVLVQDEDGSVLDRQSLLASLRYQAALLDDETVDSTLTDGGIIGIENAVAVAALAAAGDGESETGAIWQTAAATPINDQIAALEDLDDTAVESLVEELLDPADGEKTATELMALLPTDYEPGSTEATARLTLVTQQTDGIVLSPPELDESVRDAQVRADELADDIDEDEYRLVGYGLMVVEEESTNDSLALIGPFALLFVIAALYLAYRDLLDLVLGLVGIGLVLIWTFGAMGYLGIDMTVLMLATPVLLIGLSIDYCIHVVMRFREEHTGNGSDRSMAASTTTAMDRSLRGLAPALTLVTVTAMIGFVSIHASGIPSLGEFGVATAAGIFGALVVFGGFIPAVKVVLERWSIRRGRTRQHRAFGTTGPVRRILVGVVDASLAHPGKILVVVMVLSTAGVAAGTQLDAEFASEDYLAEEAPSWATSMPEPLAPGSYEVRESLQLLFDRFQSPEQRIHFLIDEGLTEPATLSAVETVERLAANASVTYTEPTGDPAVSGPITLLHEVAATNDTVAAALDAADTNGDGLPDADPEGVFAAVVAAAPEQAASYLEVTEDGIESMQVVTSVSGTISATAISDEMHEIEAAVDDEIDITTTGDLILNELVQRQLSTTLVYGLLFALAAVLAVLVGAFWYTRSSATLGVVTLVPVLLALSWILGGMYLAGLPFSFATAMIGSIAIGLGVDYAIHMSERFSHELERTGTVDAALKHSVVGTGGALLGSAVTTAGGFGVLVFSLVPVMQQFGLVIALTIAFAFVASVVALPSLLVLWARNGGWDRS